MTARYGRRTLRLMGSLMGAGMLLSVVTLLLYERDTVQVGLIWNLFLAAWPPLFALLLVRRNALGKRGPLSAVWWVLWLVMLPNAPYMFTDLIHIQQYSFSPGFDLLPGGGPWVALLQIVAMVAVGVTSGYLSLYLLHQMVRQRRGPAQGWLLCAGTSLLCGIGIYIGRFMRFNSWDLLHRPFALLQELWQRLGYNSIAFVILFTAMTMGGYLLFFVCFDTMDGEKTGQGTVPNGNDS